MLRRRTLASLSLVFLLSGCVHDRIRVVNEFRAAREAKDFDRARAALGSDPRIWYERKQGAGSPWRIEGGRWAAWDAEFRGRSRLRDWSVGTDHVRAIAWETNDYYELLGRGEQPVALTWFFDDAEKIVGLLVSGEGLPRSTGAEESFLVWARTHAPEELEYLRPGGEVDPTEDRPLRHRLLLERWREAESAASRR